MSPAGEAVLHRDDESHSAPKLEYIIAYRISRRGHPYVLSAVTSWFVFQRFFSDGEDTGTLYRIRCLWGPVCSDCHCNFIYPGFAVDGPADHDHLSPEEEEKKRIRRERNKMAAAKCRNRRRELTDTLQAETDKLEDDKAALQTEIANLLKEKEKLELVLAAHKPACKIAEDLDCIFQEPIGSPQLLSALENGKLTEDSSVEPSTLQDSDAPSFPTTAISGNSNILLCSSAEVNICDLEPSLDVKEEPLEDLLPGMEKNTLETARSVPDIDLSSSFGVTDWETLYKSVASDLEPLTTPIVTSTPTCTSYLSAFSFTYPELDSLAEGVESRKGGAGKTDSVIDILNSPTLLAL
ncbi:hypothetical protein JZ751_002815 [Albula glossodonta]|uniref:BZIP domain-containing protein n=1 Tax=Albula glossodonta TaxID=121402 RepID=A0A8T2NFM0_9TELE|nr:hypothetical protein JZ751_002815 [Albula glossodonta]